MAIESDLVDDLENPEAVGRVVLGDLASRHDQRRSDEFERFRVGFEVGDDLLLEPRMADADVFVDDDQDAVALLGFARTDRVHEQAVCRTPHAMREVDGEPERNS